MKHRMATSAEALNGKATWQYANGHNLEEMMLR